MIMARTPSCVFDANVQLAPSDGITHLIPTCPMNHCRTYAAADRHHPSGFPEEIIGGASRDTTECGGTTEDAGLSGGTPTAPGGAFHARLPAAAGRSGWNRPYARSPIIGWR